MDLLLTLLPVVVLALFVAGWGAMLVDALHIPSPARIWWILAIVLGGPVGSLVYYFVGYPASNHGVGPNRKHRSSKKLWYAIIGVIIAFSILVAASIQRPSDLERVPLSKVIAAANNGEVSKIVIDGRNITVTVKGAVQPTQRTTLPPGSSLDDQGLKKDAPVSIRYK
jgi:hypothetical protein